MFCSSGALGAGAKSNLIKEIFFSFVSSRYLQFASLQHDLLHKRKPYANCGSVLFDWFRFQLFSVALDVAFDGFAHVFE
jgi:hypothetical protein